MSVRLRPSAVMSIKKIRTEIDKIDYQILKLLNLRCNKAIELSAFKKASQMPLYDPKRENYIISKLKKLNKGPLINKSLAHIYKEIFSACLFLQKPLSVAFLGPKGTFTHTACIKKFGSSIEEKPQRSIRDVFITVEKGEADFGIVPFENSIEGIINQTLDKLVETKLVVCGEIFLNISLKLLSTLKNIKDIKIIYTHPQAFAQCEHWIRENLPNKEFVNVSSTAEAALSASKNPYSAAISGNIPPEVKNLNILASDIQDYSDNKTKFIVIGNSYFSKTDDDKTMILFSVKHVAGSLFKAIKPFEQFNINMSAIHSRPFKKSPFEYVFIIEFEGHIDDPIIQSALSKIKKNTLFFRFLGSYSSDLHFPSASNF